VYDSDLMAALIERLDLLAKAIEKQATAVQALAESNEKMVDALADLAPEGEADEPQFDLSGKPLR